MEAFFSSGILDMLRVDDKEEAIYPQLLLHYAILLSLW